MTSADQKRRLNNWLDEQNSAAIYHALSQFEKDPQLAEVYQRMADVEIQHAAKWEKALTENGFTMPVFKTSLRTRIQIALAKRMGAAAVLPGIQAMEQNGSAGYKAQADAAGMVADEQSHARLLQQLGASSATGMEGSAVAQLEGRHRATGGNALRAAVLGANDGLVSNLSLVMGVAGAALDNRTILITGLAGMLAGAISMALGEWLSVQSSRELFAHQIEIEKEEVENAPEEEVEELALIYQSRGLSTEQAHVLASQIMQNQKSAVETLAREELSINPEELGGSAWEAAITSFFLFAIGAIIPVSPYIFTSGMTAVYFSIGLSIIGLFILGAAITLFTGRTVFYSGLRMVIFGSIAAAVTFGIGYLIGGNLGG